MSHESTDRQDAVYGRGHGGHGVCLIDSYLIMKEGWCTSNQAAHGDLISKAVLLENQPCLGIIYCGCQTKRSISTRLACH